MYKKIILIALALVMLLTFSACGDDEKYLNEYKELTKQELDDYVASKGRANYDVYDWAELMDIAIMCKKNIDAAKNSSEVDDAFEYAMDGIDGVPTLEDGPIDNEDDEDDIDNGPLDKL